MQQYSALDNYISMHRKAAGLSQDELAVLLGVGGRSAVAKYELALRMPELEAAIAFEIIFDEPIQSVFAGVAHRIQNSIRSRARALSEATPEKQMASNADKIATLARLAHLDEDEPIEW
jgi:transcriptional regulator with XRE-family HTH domain